jgi:hypothetical protein
VASYMIKKGFKNVKIVHAGSATSSGGEMEKFFEHYISTKYKTKIINPMTGKVTVIKQGR